MNVNTNYLLNLNSYFHYFWKLSMRSVINKHRYAHKKKFRGGAHKKIYNYQYLSMNDDTNKLHNYSFSGGGGGEPPKPPLYTCQNIYDIVSTYYSLVYTCKL